MFFRETTSKNSKNPTLQLVENNRTEKGTTQTIIVSLGTQFIIPKDKQRAVAKQVYDRLIGQRSLFNADPVTIERRIGRQKERFSKVAKYYEITYDHKDFDYIISRFQR